MTPSYYRRRFRRHAATFLMFTGVGIAASWLLWTDYPPFLWVFAVIYGGFGVFSAGALGWTLYILWTLRRYDENWLEPEAEVRRG